MMTPRPAAVVFTDLDGTLLDHHSYGWDRAASALEDLKRRGIPVVLSSSKTRDELFGLQETMGLEGPVIAENGGGVFLRGQGPLAPFFPDRVAGLPARVFGVAYPTLRTALVELAGVVAGRFTGFGDVGDDVVARWTGLSLGGAALARRRAYDEPFVWEPEPTATDVALVHRLVVERSLVLTRGGRFWHLTGDNDKGRAAAWVAEVYGRFWGRPVRTLALGDSVNDLPMLCSADTGVLVARPDGTHLPDASSNLRKVPGIGPEGWRQAVEGWLLETRKGR